MGIALLLVVTGVVVAAGVVVVRDGLRWAGELLSVVAVALLAVTFAAAADEDALGLSRLDGRQASWVTAVLVVVGALGWSRLARRSRTGQLVGVQVVGVVAAWRLVMLAYDERWTRTEYVAFGIVAVLLSVAWYAARKGIWIFAVWTAALAVLNLVIAVGASFVRVVLYDEVADLWETGRVIGWVACILFAWLVARSRKVAMGWRGLAAAFVVAGTGLLLLRPLEGSGYDAVTGGVTATFAALATVSLVLLNPWRRGVRLGSVPAGLVAASVIGPSVMNAIGIALAPATSPWSLGLTDHPDSDVQLLDGIGSPWLIAVAALALLVATEVVVTRRLPRREVVLAMAVSAGAIAVLRYSMPLWAVVAALTLAAVVTGCLAVATPSMAIGVMSGVLGFLTLASAVGSDVTTLAAGVVLAIALAVLTTRVRARPRQPALR